MKAKLIISIKPGKKLDRTGYFHICDCVYNTKRLGVGFSRIWTNPIDLKD
jgi:hypothetical protein